MKREKFAPRHNFEERCKEIGFDFHGILSRDGEPYWREEVGYSFGEKEIDALEEATNTLHQMCLDLVGDIVRSGDYPEQYSLSDAAKMLVESSWRSNEPGLYGRFDLAYNDSDIKLLEYNSDTPTSLLEAAIAQWHWKEDRRLPDQFNSIHERLIERWKIVKESIAIDPRVYFSATENGAREDWGNLEYLMDTAMQAGIEISEIAMEKIGWDGEREAFVDVNDNIITACFKLYPWEWLMSEEFGANIPKSRIRFIEPAWKMLLSSKAILPLLWKKHEGHSLLLPAFFEDVKGDYQPGEWARKPILSREGANVSVIKNNLLTIAPGSDFIEEYDSRYIVQQWVNLQSFDGFYPVIGSWVIGDESAGISIREDQNVVTGNNSHFVPHYFK